MERKFTNYDIKFKFPENIKGSDAILLMLSVSYNIKKIFSDYKLEDRKSVVLKLPVNGTDYALYIYRTKTQIVIDIYYDKGNVGTKEK